MTSQDDSAAWSSFWTGADGSDAAVRSSDSAASFDRFWTGVYARTFDRSPAARCADLACGAGTVAAAGDRLAAARGIDGAHFILADYSEAAVQQAVGAMSSVGTTSIVADAGQPLLEPGSQDLVTSQFGLEYAGEKAFDHAWSGVAPGGELVALIHMHDGPIYEECKINLSWLDRLSESDLIGRFKAQMDLTRRFELGKAARDETVKHENELVTDTNTLMAEISRTEPNPAAAFVYRLLQDMVFLYQRRQAYSIEESDKWLDHQAGEAEAYSLRMSSMMAAAMRQADIESRFALDDVESRAVETFSIDGEERPCAWMVSLTRSAG